MITHHLISIEDSQLSDCKDDPSPLLTKIGAAVVVACVGDDKADKLINQANSADGHATVKVKHLTSWVRAARNELRVSDLNKDDLLLLQRLVNAVLHRQYIPETKR